MKRINANYKLEVISVRITCHQCNRQFPSPSGEPHWSRDDIARQFHTEMICFGCSAVNRLPERLLNTVAGF